MATTTATRAVPSTLPLELGGISDERRQQLELRRQREMTRQQESRAGTAGNFRWSPIAMIPAHLCVLIFLVFLLEKLEGSIDWPWAAVLSPLWITDAVFIVIKVGVVVAGFCSESVDAAGPRNSKYPLENHRFRERIILVARPTLNFTRSMYAVVSAYL